ncbi:MAG: hypothetical protein HQL21_07290 [Candidatus Omnitrophica bacterium]|nr:hypothetical protein [Candidatus Omnitrophota bacterium]
MSLKAWFLDFKEHKPVGVLIFGFILVSTSIDQLHLIPTYEAYRHINHEWPENIIKIRFVISYVLRLVGLCAGIGILCFSNVLRKGLLWLSVFSVMTLPLRHTYSAQFIYSEPLYRLRGSMFSLETFVWIAVILRWMIDGIFSLCVIYYFTRPQVMKHFK